MILKYVVIVLISLLLSGFFYHRTQPALSSGRRWLLFGLRFLSLGIVLLFLLSPIFYYVQHLNEKQQIVVLRDVSSSMNLRHGKAAKKNLLDSPGRELIAKFQESGYEILDYDFANGLHKDERTTLLAPALAELTKKHDFTRVKGVLLISDGWLRDADLQQAKHLGAPFFALADTSRIPNADLSVVRAIANRYSYRTEPTLIRAELRSENYSGPATVKLLMGNTPLATQSVNLTAGSLSTVDFTQRFNITGLFPFRVEVSAAGVNERSQQNNSYPGALEVLNDKEKVVIISDSPAWDNKFIVDAISANTRWEASHFRLNKGILYSGETAVKSLPAENLAAVVMLNNGNLQLTGTALSYVQQSHKRGVGIFFQGLPLPEISDILPLQRSNVTTSYQGFIELSPSASAYPMFAFDPDELQNIPPLDYYYVTAAKSAQVLATINNPQKSPAIAVQTQTNGKVLAYAFLNLWKWQLQSKAGSYRDLITNSITWLANKSASGFNAIYNASYFLGEKIDIRLRAEDDIRSLRLDLNPRLKVFDAENKEVFSDFLTQSEGEYAVGFSLGKPGQYRFELRDEVSGESTTGKFNVADTSLESRDFDFNLPLLSWLANDTGGKLLTPAAVKAFAPLPAQSRKLDLRRDIPLYRKWYILSLFILAFCLELFFRRRWGLL